MVNMREENLAGESFTGKMSTGDVTRDEARAKEMEDQVLAMLERQETNNMMPHNEEERGGLYYYCRECKSHGAIDVDPEKGIGEIACPMADCGNKKVAIGTERSLRNHFRIAG